MRKGIETIYAGTRFRSRLEARWAAFFDLGKRQWEYEPFDLDGYVPDFVLYGQKRNAMVEIKPSALTIVDNKKMRSAAEWCAANDWRLIILNECLINPVQPGKWYGWDTGEFYEQEPVGLSRNYGKEHDFVYPTLRCGKILFHGSQEVSEDKWTDAVLAQRRVGEEYYLDFGIEGSYEEALDNDWPEFAMDGHWQNCWAEARNITQWLPS